MIDQINRLSKNEFTPILALYLKEEGYVKKRTYWFKRSNSILLCVHLQSSLWDKDDYYINIGVSNSDISSYPNELRWYWWHRCSFHNTELNLTLDEIRICMINLFGDYQQLPEKDFFSKHCSTRLNGRYIVMD